MCSKCKNVLIGFAIQHSPSDCPLLRSSYCSVCCSYGHLTEDCPDDDVLQCREVQFMEQLISKPLRDHYNIQSRTPIPPCARPTCLHDPVLEVEESDKAIRQVLMNYEIAISGRMKENRRRLKQLSEELGRKLVYLTPK